MKRFFHSLKHALRGLSYAFRNEHNFQIEIVFAVLVFLLAVLFQLSSTEQSILLIAVCIVLALELLNTAVERLVDIMKPRVHPYAKVVKDIMAAAVLIASLSAVLIGFIIFFPRIVVLFH